MDLQGPHLAPPPPEDYGLGGYTTGAPMKPVMPTTCLACFKSHVKCERTIPCKRCTRLGLRCVPNPRPRGRPKKVPNAFPGGPASLAHLPPHPSSFPSHHSGLGRGHRGLPSALTAHHTAQGYHYGGGALGYSMVDQLMPRPPPPHHHGMLSQGAATSPLSALASSIDHLTQQQSSLLASGYPPPPSSSSSSGAVRGAPPGSLGLGNAVADAEYLTLLKSGVRGVAGGGTLGSSTTGGGDLLHPAGTLSAQGGELTMRQQQQQGGGGGGGAPPSASTYQRLHYEQPQQQQSSQQPSQQQQQQQTGSPLSSCHPSPQGPDGSLDAIPRGPTAALAAVKGVGNEEMDLLAYFMLLMSKNQLAVDRARTILMSWHLWYLQTGTAGVMTREALELREMSTCIGLMLPTASPPWAAQARLNGLEDDELIRFLDMCVDEDGAATCTIIYHGGQLSISCNARFSAMYMTEAEVDTASRTEQCRPEMLWRRLMSPEDGWKFEELLSQACFRGHDQGGEACEVLKVGDRFRLVMPCFVRTRVFASARQPIAAFVLFVLPLQVTRAVDA